MSDVERFGRADRLLLEVRWQDTENPLADEADGASWALLRIVVGGRVVTRHVFGDEGVADELLLPLAPVALWFARSWSRLWGEERFVGAGRIGPDADVHRLLEDLDEETWDRFEEEIDDWLQAHALRSVGAGLLLPDVLLWRRGGEMAVSWRADAGPQADGGVQFLESGASLLPLEAVFEPLERFVRRVNERVRARAPETSPMRRDLERWARRALDPRERAVAMLAARVGRSESSVRRWLQQREAGEEALGALARAYGLPADMGALEGSDSPLAMAARSASPCWTDEDHEALLQLGQQLRGAEPASGLVDLARQVAEPHGGQTEADHERGYRRAARVRAVLGNDDEYLDVEALLRDRGCLVRSMRLGDPETDAVALWDEEGRALVAWNEASPRSRTPWGRRAALAHELYHLLFDRTDRRLRCFGESLGPWTPSPSERVANAFAAELLLPRAALPAEPPEDDEEVLSLVQRLCSEYGVGWELAVRQLDNRTGRKMARGLVDALLEVPRGRSGALRPGSDD